jgi:hypothetical protein
VILEIDGERIEADEAQVMEALDSISPDADSEVKVIEGPKERVEQKLNEIRIRMDDEEVWLMA